MSALDGLRGLALFGVLAINLTFGFRVPLAQNYLPAEPLGQPDHSLHVLLVILVEHKALTILGLLFGGALAIQFDRLAGDPRRAALFLRRQGVLLVLGAAHLLLLWSGDILVDYAIAGLIALPILLASPRIIGAIAALLLACGPVMALVAITHGLDCSDWYQANASRSLRIYSEGSFASIVAFRIEEVMVRGSYYAILLPWTLGPMLLGAFFWRSHLVERAQRGSTVVLRTAIALLAIGLASNLITYPGLVPIELSDDARVLVWSYGSMVMALGYAGLVLSWQSDRARRWLGFLAPLGRITLTAYVSQSAIMGLIFHGYGLGAMGKLSIAEGLAIVVAIFGAQLLVARWWLAHFHYGPLEWLWRSLTYGRRLPFRRSSAA